jgi:hypothetical protein
MEIPAIPNLSINGPILRLKDIVEVSERYKNLFPQLLEVFQKMYDEKDKKLLIDLQPLSMFVSPDKGQIFKKVLDDIRSYLNIAIKDASECRKRLARLKTLFNREEERKLINNALDLLNLPPNSEVQSNADFEFLALQQSVKDLDTATDIQEIFIFLNSLFSSNEVGPESSSRQNKSGKTSSVRRR